MDASLVYISTVGEQKDIPFKRGRIVVGRKKECDIHIGAPNVSREHCEVVVMENGLVVRDLGSSNGTFVNQSRVQEAMLRPGDVIGVGPAVFVVRINGVPSSVDVAGAMSRAIAGAAGAVAERSASMPSRPAVPPPAARPAAPGAGAGRPADEADASSMMDFDFDLDDDDDDQIKKQPRL